MSTPWGEHQDDQGRTYWFNTATGESSWTNPLPPEEQSANAVYQTLQKAMLSKSSRNSVGDIYKEVPSPRQLTPQGSVADLAGQWSKHQDSDGNTFYYNTMTDESSWTTPAGYQELSASASKVTIGGHSGPPPDLPLPATPGSPAPGSPAPGAPALPPMRAGATVRGGGDSNYAAPDGNYDSVARPNASGPDETKLKSFVQGWAGPQSNEVLTNATKAHAPAVDPRTQAGSYEYSDYSTSGDKEKTHHSYQYVPFQVVMEGVDLYVALNKKKTIRDCYVQIEAQFSCAFRDRPGVKVQLLRSAENDVVPITDLAGSYPAYSKFTAETKPEDANEERDKSTDLDFRTKRKVKIVTMGGDTKTLMVDDGAPASVVMSQVAAKMGLINYQEFWLFVLRDPSEAVLQGRGGAGKSREGNSKRRSSAETKTFRKSNSQGNLNRSESDPSLLDARLVTCWLRATESLNMQGIKMSETVYLRRRFFFLDDTVYVNDPVCLKLIYCQARQTILAGEVESNEQQAVALAALQLQISKGDHEKSQFSKEDQLADFIHDAHTRKGSNKVKEAIYEEWAKLKGIKPENAEYLYVKLYNTLPMWGITFIEGKWADPKRKKVVPMLLGISRTAIMKVDAKTRAVEQRWDLKFVHHYAHSPEFFKLYYENAEEVLIMLTENAADIAATIDGYTNLKVEELNQRKIR